MLRLLFAFACVSLSSLAQASDANRLAWLQECNPWYPDQHFAKLLTPQWVGEEGVEAVVIFAIDDMRDTAKYEQYLRPILDRLKQIDGRAPVSIMTCDVKPDDPQLQSWLDEGLSIEVHTVDHPCPLLQSGDLDKARSTVGRCIDLLHKIPRNSPVAFRTPCCDSLNTVSPRFYSTIFDTGTPDGHALQIDSSVFNFFTSEDKSIPRALVLDENGEERFLKYMPRNNTYKGLKHDNFVNYIENYPYPYVINNCCWQFPCVAPSDWSAQHLHGENNPVTVNDWKAALDITVHKQGVFNLVFHPHGWMKAEQVVEFIDHSVEKHGRKVKFLTFREAADLLNKNLLRLTDGTSINAPDRGIRVVDLDGDGDMDVVRAGGVNSSSDPKDDTLEMFLWQNDAWETRSFPVPVAMNGETTAHFYADHKTDAAAVFVPGFAGGNGRERRPTTWTFTPSGWKSEVLGTPLEETPDQKIHVLPDFTSIIRDFDGDGNCEIMVIHCSHLTDEDAPVIHFWHREGAAWKTSKPYLPLELLNDYRYGLNFSDVNADGALDCICIRDNRYDVYLFDSLERGWKPTGQTFKTPPVNMPPLKELRFALPWESHAGPESGAFLPPRPSGVFVHGNHLCWQNEFTADRPDLTLRVPLDEVLGKQPINVLQLASERPHHHAAARWVDTEGKLLASQKPAPPQPLVPVGAARIDITPEFPVRLTGYGNRAEEFESVASRIHARALSIQQSAADSQDANHVVLVTVDNCGVPASVTDAVYHRVAAKHSIPRSAFAISSTHTHSGPWLRDFAPNILLNVTEEHAAHLQQYEAELITKLTALIDTAISNQRPARLSLGRGRADFAVNRRVLEAGQWTGFGEVPDAPVDRQLSVLAAHDANGELIAVLTNYACHATTETGQFNSISGDWPGHAADRLEEKHAGAIALVAIGCGADANPSPRGTHELAMQHGQTFADEVNRLLAGTEVDSSALLSPIDPKIACNIANIDLPLAPLPARDVWETRAKRAGHEGVWATQILQLLDEGKPVPTTVPNYPIQTWCFGQDLAMVFLGGEVVVDYALRLNEMFDDQRLWLNAYSNDVPSYISSKRILREGGYEADRSMTYYNRPGPLAPQTEDMICDTVQRLLPHTFYSTDLQAAFPGPKSPEESLASITTNKDVRVELVAAEPLITDPVAFDWDVQGRLWVVEMGDYPGVDGQADEREEDGGRVRVLADTDNDGKYDKATTFLSGLHFPTGIHRWRNGVIITAAPDIIYAEDTDGDFKADIRKVLYTGFVEGNQQHRVNGLRWSLDGWLHVGNGDSGGEIRAVDRLIESQKPFSETAVNIGGRDLRIQPDSGLIETLSGRTQFGRERDDFGNWFGNNNSNPIWHYVLEDRYLRRNPHAIGAATKSEVTETPGAAPVFPTSKTLSRFNDFDKANRFTSACSTSIYRDNYLGQQFYGNAFTCEPVHNLVSRLVLERDGVSFKGKRAADEQDAEFFASSDNWTRPVMVRTGPDGAIYIADMYRQVIEHPEWIPPEYQRKMDLQSGSSMGRIYRVVPAAECCQAANATDDAGKTTTMIDPQPELRQWFQQPPHTDSTAELQQRLASPNGWWRDTAQRLLSHLGRDLPHLQATQLVRSHASPAVRVQAIHTLVNSAEQTGMHVATFTAALSDEHLEVRRAAILALEPLLAASDLEIPAELLAAVDDQSLAVRQQLALTLGASRQPSAAKALARLLLTTADSPAVIAAAMTSLNEQNLSGIVAQVSEIPTADADRQLLTDLVRQSAAISPQRLPKKLFSKLLMAVKQQSDVAAFQQLASLLNDLERRASQDETFADEVAKGLDSIELHVGNIPGDQAKASQLRAAAIRLLCAIQAYRWGDYYHPADALVSSVPVDVQMANVELLARPQFDNEDMVELFLERWPNCQPRVREAAVTAFLHRTYTTNLMLDALQEGTLSVRDFNASQREQLLNHHESKIAVRSKTLLNAESTSSRQQLVDSYLEQLGPLTGQPESGKGIFEKRCSTCHRLQNIGKAIGADLAAIKDRSTPAMLTAILDPNKAVETKFLQYTALTADGVTRSGMLLSETGNSIKLLGSDGKEATVARTELEELICSNRSLMPEGFEKDLLPQDLADVISFVQSSGSPWKQFQGNTPSTVVPAADGSLTLYAATAEIYGPSLVFEDKHNNLGWWSSTDDRAVWKIDVPKSGHWTVEIDYACDNSTAGHILKLSTSGRLLSGRVPGTGTWDDFRRWTVGKMDLHRGQSVLIVTSPEKPAQALIDLRSIRLIPPQ